MLSDDDLRAFVHARATRRDPAAGDYPALALTGAIRTTRRSAIYGMHSYHQGKKPHDAIRQYIRHFSRPGELVLDPFCGSGGTALAAMLEGRTAIALDRSPAAVFIARNYCATLDPDEVLRATKVLMAAARPELDWLYQTRCDRCGGAARTVYTVYSERFCCPHCREIAALSACPRASTGSKPLSACPSCLARGHVEAIRTRGAGLGAIPVLAVYRCLGGCLPAEDQRRHDDPDAKKRDYFARFDLGKIEEIARSEIPHWRPNTTFPTSFARWQTDLRPAGIASVADLYTKRNLWALAATGNQAAHGRRGRGYTLAQRQRFHRVGIREFFRLRKSKLETMGDCGAFSYIREPVPPVSPEEVFNFYEECGFDYGVSVDHIIGVFRPDLDRTRSGVDSALDNWRKRQEITLQLARDFWRLCQKRNPRFEPIPASTVKDGVPSLMRATRRAAAEDGISNDCRGRSCAVEDSGDPGSS